MKLALIFLSVCFVAISHQQFHQPRSRALLWWSPYYQSLPVDREDNYPQFSRQLMRRPSRPPPYFYGNYGDFNSDLIELNNEPNEVNDATFPDAESRIKSSNHFLQDSFYNQQSNPRFIYTFGNTASFYNPFFKTATFTVTSTLTLASIQSCVPSFQVSPVPVACRRKRNEIEDFAGEQQFSIVPSETFKLLPTELSTELSPSLRNLDQISSSKFENTYGEKSPGDDSLREKRGFFINKNQLVVSSTLTTYAFVNRTVTATVNLINPPPAAQCVAAPPPPTTTTLAPVNGGRKRRQAPAPARTARQAAPVVQCVACLPSGFIVCPASG